MTFLLLSLAALLAGPALFTFAKGRRSLPPVLDAVVVLSITVLILLEFREDVVEGPAVLIISAAVIGLFGPTLIESVLHRIDYHRIEVQAHVAALVLGVSGLALHGLLDGAALAPSADVGESLLPAAIALHRIPVGLTVWWLLRPTFGTAVAWSGLAVVAVASCVGFAVGPPLLAQFSTTVGIGFQAFVSGTLLHVIFFRTHVHEHDH